MIICIKTFFLKKSLSAAARRNAIWPPTHLRTSPTSRLQAAKPAASPRPASLGGEILTVRGR